MPDLPTGVALAPLRGTPAHVTAGALALALAPALWPSDAAAHTCDAPFRTDLVTARGIDVGQVAVCNDAEFLTVTYETTFPWCVLKTNLHVARDLAGIPKIRLLGTPNFLRFDFSEEVDCEGDGDLRHSLGRDRRRGRPGRHRHVAARAVVEGEGPDGTHPRCLLGDKCVAWGKGSRFRPRLPAMYFTYEVQEAITCGDGSKCVFVSSTVHNGNLGGLTGADASAMLGRCGGPPGRRLLHGMAVGQLSLTFHSIHPGHGALPPRRWNANRRQLDRLDRRAGLDESISVDEDGDANFVWTGTTARGAPFPLAACSDWTSSSFDDIGQTGSPLQNNFIWSEAGSFPCGELAHLYCFQQ